MKFLPNSRGCSVICALSFGLLFLALLPGCKKKPAPAPGPAPKPAVAAVRTNSVATNTDMAAEFVSVFDDRPPPENSGLDPFNPQSSRRVQAPPPISKGGAAQPPPPAAGQLKLLGIVGSPGRRLVQINNQLITITDPPTSVRIPGGTVIVKVVEIGEDYADVMVEGISGKQRLTIGQKK